MGQQRNNFICLQGIPGRWRESGLAWTQDVKICTCLCKYLKCLWEPLDHQRCSVDTDAWFRGPFWFGMVDYFHHVHVPTVVLDASESRNVETLS